MNWTVVFALTAGLAILIAWIGLAAWVGAKVIDKYMSLGWAYVAAFSVMAVPIILIIGLVV